MSGHGPSSPWCGNGPIEHGHLEVAILVILSRKPRNRAAGRGTGLWLLLGLCSSMLMVSSALAAGLTADEAVRQLEARHQGRVLDIQPVETGSGPAYRIKLLLPSGRVRLLVMDAEDGQLRQFGGQSEESRGEN